MSESLYVPLVLSGLLCALRGRRAAARAAWMDGGRRDPRSAWPGSPAATVWRWRFLPAPARRFPERALRCPFCNQDDDKVIDSRATDDGTAIRRRRACNVCSKRFTTYERVEGEESLTVVKKDGRRQGFDRRKVLHGMTVACEKRPVPVEDLEASVNRIYHKLISDGVREVSSERIGQLVMFELLRLAVEFGEHLDLGAQHLGHDRHRDVVDGAHLVALEPVDIGQWMAETKMIAVF